jgi:pimeloyl-ACP methyl ester carboxylesterase
MLLTPMIALVRILNRLGLYRRNFPLLDLRELDRETRALMAGQGASKALVKRYSSLCFDRRFLPMAAYLQSLRELLRPLPPLENITIPMLLLFSTGKIFSDPAIARDLCENLTNCRTLELEAHHWIPTERPVEMREAIEQWCRELPF